MTTQTDRLRALALLLVAFIVGGAVGIAADRAFWRPREVLRVAEAHRERNMRTGGGPEVEQIPTPLEQLDLTPAEQQQLHAIARRWRPQAAQAIAQLGAYLVLDGGSFSPANSSAGESDSEPLCNPADHESCGVNLYLTPTRVWALDSQLRPLVVIPAGEISMATALPSQSDWILRIRWQENFAEFIFDGLFSERRARLAEAGLRHLIQQKGQSPAAQTHAKAAGA